MTKHKLYSENIIEGEIWKDIVGYEGLYQASDLGRIKALARTVKSISYRTTREKILNQYPREGYLHTRLVDINGN